MSPSKPAPNPPPRILEMSILYHATPGQRLLGLAAGDCIVELHIHRPSMLAGSIILGRVLGNAPGTNGLFVEIGQERPGFLTQHAKSSSKYTHGQEIVVQIKADAVHGKGATLSTDIAFQGRWLTYTPKRPGLGGSRRLGADEHDRLMELLTPLARDNEGISLRTAAEGKNQDDLARELAVLRAHWHHIKTTKAASHPPALLWRPDPLERLLALHPHIQTVRVTTPALLAETHPKFGDVVKLDTRDAEALIDHAIDEACAPVIGMASGGRISIGQMAAVTAIDVDSGHSTPEIANQEAVGAIARAIRLRGLGGQMVIDFIPSGGKGSLAKWGAALKRALSKDPVTTTVLGATPMGLVEVTRERRGPSIPELLMDHPQPQLTPISLGLAALAKVVAESAHRPGRPLTLSLPPAVVIAVEIEKTALREAREAIAAGLNLKKDITLAGSQFAIEEGGAAERLLGEQSAIDALNLQEERKRQRKYEHQFNRIRG